MLFGSGDSTESVRLCSRWIARPLRSNENETKTHLPCRLPQDERSMAGASFDTRDTQVKEPRITSGCGVDVIDHTSHKPSGVPPTSGWSEDRPRDRMVALPPGSAVAEVPWVPGLFRPHFLGAPGGPLRSCIWSGCSTSADHPHELGWVRCSTLHRVDAADLWCVWNTGLTPVTGQILLVTRA